MPASLPPFPLSLYHQSILIEKIRRNAAIGYTNGIRIKGVMSTPPTVTAASTLPGGLTKAYTLPVPSIPGQLQGVGRLLAGKSNQDGSLFNTITTAIIGTTGGNLSFNNGAQGSASRLEVLADCVKMCFEVRRSSGFYRFLVNDQYVNVTGTQTTSASPGSTTDFLTLDFTAAGGRAVRKFAIENPPDGGAYAFHIGPTETCTATDTHDLVRSVALGDSYIYGTSATFLADAYSWVWADLLGNRAHLASGSGGTGWATTSSAYTFNQRIANGDLGLVGTPDIILLGGSVNDNGRVMATLTANVTAGLTSARTQYPNALIILAGVWPANTNANATTLQNENAVIAGFNAWTDPAAFSFFIPISTDPIQIPIYGLGYVGAPTGVGNSDIYTYSDQTHPSPAAMPYIGRWLADATLRGIDKLGAAA